MVDLHQVEPGLPDGHPWLSRSRWRMALRAGLGVSVAGMAGVLLVALIPTGRDSLDLMGSLVPILFALVIPVISAGVIAVLGPWLTRYYPFSQSLLVGGFVVVAVAVLSGMLSLAESFLRGPCRPDTVCSAPFDGALWVVGFFALPTFLSASIGFGVAIWSPTERGRRIFTPAIIVLSAVFVTVLVLRQG